MHPRPSITLAAGLLGLRIAGYAVTRGSWGAVASFGVVGLYGVIVAIIRMRR